MKIFASIKDSFSYVLLVAVIINSFLIVYTLTQVNKLDSDVSDAKSAVVQQKQDMQFQTQMTFNEIDYQKSLLRPVVDVENNSIVIPEVGIKLPYNDITKTIQYTYDSSEYGYLRITSSLLSDHNPDRQLGCSELALVSFTNGDNINPWTESAGSVQLNDGRTVYIVSPIAFENNEGSTIDCESEVWTNITPKLVADELKKAESI